MALILAIESSCDETAAAVVEDGRKILANELSSQVDLHHRFGGVVPEIAARSHQKVINPIISAALTQAGVGLVDIDALAVTQGPGLPGALIIGMASAKALAYAAQKPLIGINHLEGHLFANYIEHEDLKPPFVALIVSGGHTLLALVNDWGHYQILGRTLDDAAGEAFDKIAKYLGFGYPGGQILSKLADEGDAHAIDFPRAMIRRPNYNFSLSGLKTAVIYYAEKKKKANEDINIPDLCASFEAAVVEVQVYKTLKAAKEYKIKTIVLAGGVAANKRLRANLAAAGGGYQLFYPSTKLCADNAAMIASAAFYHYQRDEFLSLDAQPNPNMSL